MHRRMSNSAVRDLFFEFTIYCTSNKRAIRENEEINAIINAEHTINTCYRIVPNAK